MFKIQEVKIKKSLQKSKISDYCINSYLGCLNGCSYCYASFFIKRWYHKNENWGNFVDVRINSVENIKKEIKNKNNFSVYISSMTDPYQIVEKKYKLTREILKIFLMESNSLFEKNFFITVQTKNNLIIRDLDILKKLKNINVGITITMLDEEKRKIFEKGASTIKERLKSLEILNRNSIKTYAFFGPILPKISDSYEKIYEIIKKIYETGTKEILFDKLSYFKKMEKFKEKVKTLNLYDEFIKSDDLEYLKELKRRILEVLKNFSDIKYEILF